MNSGLLTRDPMIGQMLPISARAEFLRRVLFPREKRSRWSTIILKACRLFTGFLVIVIVSGCSTPPSHSIDPRVRGIDPVLPSRPVAVLHSPYPRKPQPPQYEPPLGPWSENEDA